MKFHSYMVILVIMLLFCLFGCNGVTLSPTYSTLLDQTAALSQDTATRAQAGTLTQAQETQALVGQAATWQLFRSARDGNATPATTVPATQP